MPFSKYNTQHGFMKSSSTASTLLTLAQLICEALHVGGQVDIIYNDFTWAFDQINCFVLL